MLKVASIILTLFGASFLVATEPRRPNVVFIMADDLGWNDVGFHGGNAPTPHLDRLAKEGLELAQHYVAPVCSPTRAGLLTGRVWSRFGVTTPQNERCLPWETVTLARALSSTGYRSCLVGKWHLGSSPEWGPNQYGFEHAYGSLAGGVSPWNHRYKKGPFTETWHRNGKLIEETGHVTDLITQEAIDWLAMNQQDPFFLYVPYTAVHLPVKEPEEWVRAVPDTIEGDVPRHYAACIMHLDHCVGRIVKALDESQLRNNTLLVFTSDNGGSTAENNDLKYPDDNCPNGRLPGDNRPLRAEKGSIYEGGTRVPTIVSWPGTVAPGVNQTPVQITDWMPTLCHLAGYQPEQELKWDGVDLSGCLLEGKSLPERTIYTVAPSWRARSVRKGDWKLVVEGQDASRIHLFNIADDPSEAHDLAQAESTRVTEMLAELERMAAADRDAVVSKSNEAQK